MLHRNTSHRDGAQGETPSSSPSAAARSPSAARSSSASRSSGPMTPPSAATVREAPDPPPARQGFIVGLYLHGGVLLLPSRRNDYVTRIGVHLHQTCIVHK
ncbi:uncharacterized protein LOC110433163 isoform X1 [Sorghum bicolor]|uniref:uncharacterized protein LOC110433163 isoform X1 n=1 Tax=Sorghum bicolor TaxID=4558 RepID=UPI000B423A33|nr:uncharacterized protein LOC110433163 isoform X1 [Sorghum bicolor]|eukprot:XP_021310573.1 uncharacterized protein LOC110433163 isoform X1 [Sorghum bicolor]